MASAASWQTSFINTAAFLQIIYASSRSRKGTSHIASKHLIKGKTQPWLPADSVDFRLIYEFYLKIANVRFIIKKLKMLTDCIDKRRGQYDVMSSTKEMSRFEK